MKNTHDVIITRYPTLWIPEERKSSFLCRLIKEIVDGDGGQSEEIVL